MIPNGRTVSKKLRNLVVLCGLFAYNAHLAAQEVAIKTNVLSDAFMNINLGIEAGVAERWTIDLEGQYNGWTLSHGRRWKHWSVQPEARYWLCHRLGGHFFGVHAHGGKYNIGGFDGWYNFLGTDARTLSDTRYQGWFLGAGISYGYAWMLATHWNLEGEIGIGYSFTRYDSYPCMKCGDKLDSGKTHNYVGPTRLAVNIVYVF